MPPKKKTKPKVHACPCPCAPPPRKRRKVPAYSPPRPPQFYAALPMPQSQFDTDTIRRVVQDEFARYHTPRKTLMVSGTQTEYDFPDDVSEGTFGMSATDDSTTTSGGRRWDEEELGEEIEMELSLEQLLGKLEAAKTDPRIVRKESEDIERREMATARRAFMPTPFMLQPEEEPRMARGRYGLGEIRREEMREFLISQVEERNPPP